MGRRCGTSQPTPIPPTCKAVAEYTWRKRKEKEKEKASNKLQEAEKTDYKSEKPNLSAGKKSDLEQVPKASFR